MRDKSYYNDFLVYLDDADQKKTVYCKLIDVNFFVIFELMSGTKLSIPQNRVLKIKQKGDDCD